MPDNPYLPASVAALGEAFPLFRTFEEVPPITSESKNDNVRLVAGLKGNFGAIVQMERCRANTARPSSPTSSRPTCWWATWSRGRCRASIR